MTELPQLPEREAGAHKGTFGRVLVIAGSRGMVGAACLTTLAALRAGAGLVTLATPSAAQLIAAGRVLSATTVPLPETDQGAIAVTAVPLLERALEAATHVAIGPGLTTSAETQSVVLRQLATGIKSPCVVDADALNIAAREPNLVSLAALARRVPTVLTPHPGESARLLRALGESGITAADVETDRAAAAERLLRVVPATIVMKGANSLVIARDARAVNETGNPGMATGGSGDVLTGVIVGLLAQGLDAFAAARLGAFVHGSAGDDACSQQGELSMTAEDLLAAIPAAFARIINARAARDSDGRAVLRSVSPPADD